MTTSPPFPGPTAASSATSCPSGALHVTSRSAADAFPWARSIGWDIGLGESGPVLIEGNERWSPSLIQMPAPTGLLSGELRAVRDELGGAHRRPWRFGAGA